MKAREKDLSCFSHRVRLQEQSGAVACHTRATTLWSQGVTSSPMFKAFGFWSVHLRQ